MTVFENGRLLVDYSLEEIRERAELPAVKEALLMSHNHVDTVVNAGHSL